MAFLNLLPLEGELQLHQCTYQLAIKKRICTSCVFLLCRNVSLRTLWDIQAFVRFGNAMCPMYTSWHHVPTYVRTVTVCVVKLHGRRQRSRRLLLWPHWRPILPPVLSPPGMSQARRDYLQKMVAPYFSGEAQVALPWSKSRWAHSELNEIVIRPMYWYLETWILVNIHTYL